MSWKFVTGAFIGVNGLLLALTSYETNNEERYLELSQEACWASDRYYDAISEKKSQETIDRLRLDMERLEAERDKYY